MFTFYWPWLILLLPLPLLVRLFMPADKKSEASSTPQINFPHIERVKSAFPVYKSSGKKSSRWFTIILALIWISLVFAVMNPQLVDKFTSIKSKGHDIMLAVDLSGSMRALDFSTETKYISRVDVVKQVVGNFVKKRQGDRVGLVVFGESAYLYTPLTQDLLSVSQMLDNTVSGMAGDSTAIGDAIGVSVSNLRNRPEQSRVLILLTDGDDTASSIPPLQAAKLAKEYNIRIYAIGVGKNGAVPYPDGHGGITMVQLSMDEELLKEIAKITDGKYFVATDAEALEQIYDHIDKLEKTESDVKQYMIRKPLYRYPLGIAAALLLLICFVPLFRRAAYGI